jgi:uncharacterized protein (TIGR02001 family)
MKKTILAMGAFGALSLGAMATPALADGEEASSGFSGYVTLTSDYRFRGISQTDGGAAVQAAVNYTHDSGFFVEAWASNVDFSDFGDGDTSIEADFTLGYAVSLSDVTDFSVKGVYYWYNDDQSPDYDYWEVFATVERKVGTATTLSLEVAYTPETFAEGGAAWAVTGGVGFPIMEKMWFFGAVDLSGHFGVQAFDDDTLADYTFWDIGLSTSYDFLTFDARYVSNDLDEIECGLDSCDDGLVFSATVNWGG